MSACPKTVIAATLLLHEHSVDEIAPQLSAVELEEVLKTCCRLKDLQQGALSDFVTLSQHRDRRPLRRLQGARIPSPKNSRTSPRSLLMGGMTQSE